MTIIIPMAGAGSRFAQAGYTVPKPLIKVLGKPMYAWAVEGLPLVDCHKLIFVIRRDQPEYHQLAADIQARYRQFHPLIHALDQLTRGQAETVLAVREHLEDEAPLLIHNADTAVLAPDGWCRQTADRGADGALLVFDSAEDRWSYSRTGEDGWVAEVREKQVISRQASTGTYLFQSSREFLQTAAARLQAQSLEQGEFYVGPLYNDLILRGKRFLNVPVRDMWCLGTPADLELSVPRLRNHPAAVI